MNARTLSHREIQWMIHHAVNKAAKEWVRQGGRYAITAAEVAEIAHEHDAYAVTIAAVQEIARELGAEVIA